MSKKLKKCAIMLAIVLATSTLSVANASAEAEKMSGGEITYRITERWKAERYYIYIWDGLPGGENLYEWQSQKSRMTVSEDGATATYNVPEGSWNMMVLSNNKGNMTYDTVFNQNCIGDTFTTELDTSLAPVDDPLEPIVVWDNNPDCGRHRKINVNRLIPEGHAYLPGESDNTLFKDFCDKYGPKEDGSCLWEEEHNYNSWEEAKATLASNLNLTEEPTEGPTESDDDTTAGPHPWDTYWFEIPDFWKVEDDIYYVELWNNGNKDIYGWETEKYRIDFEEGNDSRGYIYSYLWDDDDQWDMMCISNSAGKKTLNAVFNRSDIGGVFTIKESNYKSLSNETFYEVVFNEEDCRTQRKIYFGDSIGVIGEEHTSNESDQTIFDSFCIKYGPSSDGTCYWNEAMSEKYNMSWEEAKEYVRGLLDIEDIDLAERYGLKRGLPLPENVKLPERYTNKDEFMEAGGSTDWDGYYDVYYFEAPDSWVNENKDKKEPGFEIGFYWYCGAVSELWPGVPAKKLSVLDENGNDIYADRNIYYGIAPTFATSIIWNNGIGDKVAENKEFKLQTKDIKVDDPMSNSLSDLWYEYNPTFDGADISGCLAYIPDSNIQARCPLNPEYDVFDVEWMYFDPRTGETTTEPLHDLLSGFLTRPDFYWGYDKVLLNPYYDMDYTYSSEVSEKPTEESTEAKTEAPTEKPTSTSTTATSNATTAPTNASTNTAKGTVNTAQTAPLTALSLTFVASLAVVFGVNKKKNSNI